MPTLHLTKKQLKTLDRVLADALRTDAPKSEEQEEQETKRVERSTRDNLFTRIKDGHAD